MIRPIAIYLPQYHPVPENDQWWGKGFTDWRNVVKAKPLFKGHYQPHLPSDLGFYDLRVTDAREEQAKLAKEYGIFGFCYYHYWFNGRRILERPFQEVFESKKPDYPFMLCWANENWTRTWDGGDDHILLEQNYSALDDTLHIQTLIPYLQDKRYIRVKNKPVIAIYRSTLLPNPRDTINVWRNEAAKAGIELYLCRFETFGAFGCDYLKEGFDAAIDFQPASDAMYKYKNFIKQQRQAGVLGKMRHKTYKTNLFKKLFPKTSRKYFDTSLRILDYKNFVDFTKALPFPDYKWYPSVTPGWDNSPRKKEKYFILKNATPHIYQDWLENILSKFHPYSEDENFVFINAWNEWAEGNHLEPCAKWGNRFLEATKCALEKYA